MNNEYSATEQPDPVHNDKPAMWDLVIADTQPVLQIDDDVTKAIVTDMKDRDNWGRSKYHTPLQPFNGRDALVDGYQELLDASVYLKQYIHEQDFSETSIESNDFTNVYEAVWFAIRISREYIYLRDGK